MEVDNECSQRVVDVTPIATIQSPSLYEQEMEVASSACKVHRDEFVIEAGCKEDYSSDSIDQT